MKVNPRKIVLMFGMILWCYLSESQQINLPRVDAMPSLPSPYVMRDWGNVARQYDSLVFDMNKSGTNWPLVHLGTSGNNYPGIRPIYMDTYVGSASHGTQAEAINIMPSLVGATLAGIDKSNQFGVNWIESVQDFFNLKNGQNVYLNGYSATTGYDWWYEVMPNVFFFQLYSLYPGTANFDSQFTTVANVWENAIIKMGGSSAPWKIPYMNYRAWNLSTGTPLTTGVVEPEASGSLSWLMYNAYKKRGDKKYLLTAQMSMDYLNGLTSDPSYEIQLPYGALTAAKMNAELGSSYDIGKMLNWIFNRGPLRGWGTIVGNWNGSDVSGLIGEANDAGDDYAFLMNGFQQAGALVPLVKYDKRFARAIAKWVLNVANASRLFYTPYIPQDHQDSYDWSTQNDQSAVIAHESLKQNWNSIALFARGDAIQGGWASTNLALYSSSSVGYLGAIVQKTDVDGILSLNLNKTDFFGSNVYPTYLIYNPYQTAKTITLPLGSASVDIYDAITETVLQSAVAGNTTLTVDSDAVRLLVYLPHGTSLSEKNGKLVAGENIVDYHYNYDFSGQFRIKALAAQKDTVLLNEKDTVFCTVDNAPGTVQYNWAVNGVAIPSATGNSLNWVAPDIESTSKISCTVSSGGFVVTDSLIIKAVTVIPVKPHIKGVSFNKKYYLVGDTAYLKCAATDANGGALTYHWDADSGAVVQGNTDSVVWKAPATGGLYTLSCRVTNNYGLYADTSVYALVKDNSLPQANPLIYYPFDNDVKDYSGNGYDGILSGAVPANDALGRPDRAYQFTSSTAMIYTPNRPELNFQDKITLSFWVKLDQVPEESFIISHGSWEDRYKVSVTPTRKLRWTIKTDQGTKDLDNSLTLALDTFYHFAVAYTGYAMEIYSNGQLDVFTPMSGKIQQTTKDLTIGHKDVSTNSYYLRGTADEIRIYATEIPVTQIATLPSLWDTVTGISQLHNGTVKPYPNPAHGSFFIETPTNEKPTTLEMIDMTGQKLNITWHIMDNNRIMIENSSSYRGFAIVRISYKSTLGFCKILLE